MSRLFDELYKGLNEAIKIERGEIEVKQHPSQDKLPAPTFTAVPEKSNESFDIYFTRDSFCFADDVTAPNIVKFKWQERDDSNDLFICLQKYFGLNQPDFHWRGYAGGRRIIDVVIRRQSGLTLSLDIRLQEEWKERLMREKSVWFLHCGREKNELPETADSYYSYEEAKSIYEQYVPRPCKPRDAEDVS